MNKKTIYTVLLLCALFGKIYAQGMDKISLESKKGLDEVLHYYFDLKNALVASDSKKSKEKVSLLQEKIQKINVSTFSKQQKEFFHTIHQSLKESFEKFSHESDIKKQRILFEKISENIYQLISTFKANVLPAYRQYCPMALKGKGAYWLSEKKEIQNPYFGDEMLKCGSVESQF